MHRRAADNPKPFEELIFSRLCPGPLRSGLRGLYPLLALTGASTGTSLALMGLISKWWFLLVRMPTAWARILPDVVLIGASRSGTSSMAGYLSEHPSFRPPFTKEIHYFNMRPRGGLAWYRAYFPLRLARWFATRVRRRQFLSGDFTPSYYFCPHVPRRIRERMGPVKIILMLRDPIERAFSQYRGAVIFGQEKLSFEEAIEQEPERLAGEMQKMKEDEFYYSLPYHRQAYVARGLYAEHLENWLRYHDRANLLVVQSEAFARDPRGVFAQVCGFLGIPPIDLDAYPTVNKWTEASSLMSVATRQRLAEYFHPHNERLYEMLGQRFDWTAPGQAQQVAAASGVPNSPPGVRPPATEGGSSGR